MRKEKTLRARIERRELEGSLLQREVIRDMLQRLAGILRKADEKLEQSGNVDGATVLREALVAMEREIEHFFRDRLSDSQDTEDAS